jgi:hypothetical protein
MARDEQVAQRILRRVRARNRQLAIEMSIELAMGILFTILSAGFLYGVVRFICFRFAGDGFPSSNVALGVMVAYTIGGFVAAWRQVDPFENLTPMSSSERDSIAASAIAPGYTHVNRRSVAGTGSFLMAGQVNLVSALATWRLRLSAKPELIDQAAEILAASSPDLDPKRCKRSPDAVKLLRRMNLIAPRGETGFGLTEAGSQVRGEAKRSAEGRKRSDGI